MTGLRGRLRALLDVPDTPHRTALAFGIGVFIAFFPVLGIHTLMGLAIALRWRLSRVAMLLGVFTNNPWTIAPMMAAGTALGCALLGVPADHLADIRWDATFLEQLGRSLRPYLWPFVVGNLLLGAAAGLAGYGALRALLERRA